MICKTASLALLLATLSTTAVAAQARTPEQVAAAALRAAPVWDGHNDVPWALRERRQNMIADFDFTDTTDTAEPAKDRPAMHTDLTRIKAGKVGAQFWSIYVTSTTNEPLAVQQMIEQIDVTRRLIDRYPGHLAFVTSAAEVERAMKAGKVASMLGMEGGYGIGGSLAVLRQAYAQGVRYLTLTHSKTIGWADSATDAAVHGGLTDFGRDVVREMQRIGMLVDLSHVSEATMMDALDVSRAPVIFSHSGARAINGHARNVPDAVLARLAANGGIVMVVTLPAYVSEPVRDHAARKAAETARLGSLYPGDPAAVKAGEAAWLAANPLPRATITELADHIDQVVKVAGIDHVGLGGDFDGMSTTVAGMDDVSGYPALFVELARRGYTQGQLEKIASRNMMRVLRSAEAFAASRRGEPPKETPAVG